MDVERKNSYTSYFLSSVRKDYGDRVVVCDDFSRTIPLLPSEVPFSYEHLGDVVFMMNPKSFFATALPRAEAQRECRLPIGDSYVALYGRPYPDDGYCYRVVSGEDVDVGAYPSVGELKEEGCELIPDPVCVLQPSGIYHCDPESSGLSVHELRDEDVLGASEIPSGFTEVGQEPGHGRTLGELAEVRLRVLGAAPLDLSRVRERVLPDGQAVHANWFAYDWYGFNSHVSMGYVEYDEHGKADLCLPGGADASVYWLEKENGDVITCKALVGDRGVGMRGKPGSKGYVYSFAGLPALGAMHRGVKLARTDVDPLSYDERNWGGDTVFRSLMSRVKMSSEERDAQYELRCQVAPGIKFLDHGGKVKAKCRGFGRRYDEPARVIELVLSPGALYERCSRGGPTSCSYADFLAAVNRGEEVQVHLRGDYIVGGVYFDVGN